jgi:hypothetical protein
MHWKRTCFRSCSVRHVSSNASAPWHTRTGHGFRQAIHAAARTRHSCFAGQRSITEIEIDRALQERFGLAVAARTVDVFGYGVAHAFDEPSLADYRTLAQESRSLQP